MALNMDDRKTVYVCMAGDFIHHGHINLIEKARELGEITVGLMTDAAIANYKRLPVMTYEERKRVIASIQGIKTVVPQETIDFTPNLRKLKPEYVVHGDDWKVGANAQIRKRVIETLKEWGGILVEPRYTSNISSTQLIKEFFKNGTTQQRRIKMLRRLLEVKPLVRLLQVHNGLTGLIVERTKIASDTGEIRQFDGMWLSSLAHSISKGKPDNQYVDNTAILNTVNEIFEVSTKAMVVDGNNGGHTEHFVYLVKSLERLGASAVIIEDKINLKRNSLLETAVKQEQDTIEDFCQKISAGKQAQVTDDFMIIARIDVSHPYQKQF